MKHETKMMVELLDATIPANTALTVQTEVEILELLEIIQEPALVEQMKKFSKLIPTGTAATLTGLLKLLKQMMHSSPRASDAHHLEISGVFEGLEAIPNVNLTFGTFMAICKSLLERHPHHQ